MKAIVLATLPAALLMWVAAGGTVQGQTSTTPTPTATATMPPPPPPGPVGQSTPGPINPPPPPCPPTGCATATPTITPTPTVTPSPTAVPLSAAVSLAHRTLNPGKKQTVTVTTTAGGAVSLTITFPNGNKKRKSGTAGSAGRFRFSYTQPGSRITHASRAARVQAQVMLAAQTATASKKYTIGFARLDVSVQPRTVKRGGAVTIWVHTAARTRIAVTLRYARPLPFGGGISTTGSDGWTSERVSVPRNAPRGRVDVRGNARLAGAQVGGETSFTVK